MGVGIALVRQNNRVTDPDPSFVEDALVMQIKRITEVDTLDRDVGNVSVSYAGVEVGKLTSGSFFSRTPLLLRLQLFLSL